MRATQLKNTLKALWTIKRTTCIEGPPGGGKTTIVQEVAEELGVKYIERHMPTMLVEDFGIPYPDYVSKFGEPPEERLTDKDPETRRFSYVLPDWFPTKPDSEGILCFDDRNQANADLQKVLANICQARNLHGIPLPAGWMVVSTGNRISDRAGANKVLSHLRNRETVIELHSNHDDWTGWAIKHNVNPMVIGFIRFKSDMLHDFKPDRDSNPTPRSWVEGVSSIIGVVPPESEHECFIGAVGAEAAAQFVEFVKVYRNLPDIDDLIKNPETAPVPKDANIRYALSTSLAARADKKNFDNIITFLGRMPGEFSVLTVQLAVARDKTLLNIASFGKWLEKNRDVLFG